MNVLWFIGACFLTDIAKATPTFPLRLSNNGLHLVDQNNVPFLIKEISAWNLIQALSEEDEEHFIDSVKRKGFNTLMVSILCFGDAAHGFAGGPPNWQGHSPFNVHWDFSKTNETYFQHVDRFLTMAREKGMLVLLVPAYLGYEHESWQGWADELLSVNNSVSKSRSYGRFLGNRYKNFDNIIWIAGADHAGGGAVFDHMSNIIEGIKEFAPEHYWTGHFDSFSNMNWPSDNYLYQQYIDLDGLYAFFESALGKPQYQSALERYNKGRMIFQLDQAYERDWTHSHENDDPQWLRRKNYDGLLSGCSGTSFSPGADNNPCYKFSNWRPLMNTTGMYDAMYCFQAFDSRAWYNLVPDISSTTVIAGRGSYGSIDYVCAARTEDGNTVMAYLPKRTAITVDMTRVSGSNAKGWWYNPRTGEASLAGIFSTTGTREFLPPGEGDWLLVLDNASLDLPAPGLSVANPVPFSYMTQPANNATGVKAKVTIQALEVAGATDYTIELNTSADFNGISLVKTGARSQVFEDLKYLTKYFVRVKTNLSSAWGESRSFTTVSAASATYMKSPRNNAVDQPWSLDIQSTEIIGATEYKIQVSTVKKFTSGIIEQSGPSPTVRFTNLAYNTKYFVRISTDIAPGQWGPVRAFVTGNPTDFCYLQSPANNATNVNYTTPLTARSFPGATLYTIEANTSPDFTGTSITHSSLSNTMQFDLAYNQTYYVRIKTDVWPEWGTIVKSFTTTHPASYSYMVTPANGATGVDDDAVVKSQVVPNATSYTIELSKAPDFSGPSIIKRSKSRSALFHNLDPGTTYYCRVQTNLAPDVWGTTHSFTIEDQPMASARTVVSSNQEEMDFSTSSEKIFEIYPIPSNDHLVLELTNPSTGKTPFKILTAEGIEVHSDAFEHDEQRKEIDTRSYKNGIYMVYLQTIRARTHKRIVITHDR